MERGGGSTSREDNSLKTLLLSLLLLLLLLVLLLLLRGHFGLVPVDLIIFARLSFKCIYFPNGGTCIYKKLMFVKYKLGTNFCPLLYCT